MPHAGFAALRGTLHSNNRIATVMVQQMARSWAPPSDAVRFKSQAPGGSRLLVEAQVPYDITYQGGADVKPSLPDLNHNYIGYLV